MPIKEYIRISFNDKKEYVNNIRNAGRADISPEEINLKFGHIYMVTNMIMLKNGKLWILFLLIIDFIFYILIIGNL